MIVQPGKRIEYSGSRARTVSLVRALVNSRLDAILGALSFGGHSFRPSKYQREFIKAVLSREFSRVVVTACTRSGKTVSASIAGALAAFLYPSEDVVFVAPTYSQSMIAFQIVREAILSSPIRRAVRRMSRTGIEFANGSTVKYLSAHREDSLLGHGASLIVIDEACSIDSRTFRERILRMVMATRSGLPAVLVSISTPHSLNFHYDLWRDETAWRMKVDWRDAVEAGIMNAEQVEYARRTLTEQEFTVWYEAEFVPALSDALIDAVKLRDVAVVRPKKPETRLLTARYFAGVDVARFGQDSTAVVILEVDPEFSPFRGTAVMAAVYERQKLSIAETIGLVMQVASDWRVERIGVDCNGVGAGVHDVLRERLGGMIECVPKNERERTEMYRILRQFIADGRLHIIRDPLIIEQFKSLRIKYRSDGSIHVVKTEGARDDVADATAIALYTALSSGASVYVPREMLDWLNANP